MAASDGDGRAGADSAASRALPPAQVLVVGAGPVGLALGCFLRRAGMSVRLVEKRATRSAHSKAIGLQHRVSELLGILGVADRFVARSGSPTSVNIYEGTTRILDLHFPTPKGVSGSGAFHPRPLLLPQSETERLLAELLDELGTTVEWESELVEHHQSDSGVHSLVRRGDGTTERVESQWLVSCEGAHSSVRKQAGFDFAGKSYPLAFLMADVVMIAGVSHLESHVWLHPAGSVALLPLPAENTWRLFVEVPAAETAEQSDAARVQRIVWERAPLLAKSAIQDLLWLSDFRIHARMVGKMRRGRVFLAGDAAHIHSPTGGQGITTGIHDAINLAWKLARVAGGAPDALLDTYQEERLPHVAEVLRETDRTTSVLLAPRFPWRHLRDLVVLPLLRIKPLQARMFGKFSQLHVHYRASRLSQPTDGRKPRGLALAPGDRAPDVSLVVGATGANVTLFDLLRDMRPLLLLRAGRRDEERLLAACEGLRIRGFSVPGDSAEIRPHSLIDHTGDFSRLYGMPGQLACVIRPDGHIGFLASKVDTRALSRYLGLISDPRRVEEVLPC